MISIERIEFCETLLAMAEEDKNIFDKIIWSDEAVFKPNGHVNRHNSIYWRLKIQGSVSKEI
jgi:hypothetical protein